MASLATRLAADVLYGQDRVVLRDLAKSMAGLLGRAPTGTELQEFKQARTHEQALPSFPYVLCAFEVRNDWFTQSEFLDCCTEVETQRSLDGYSIAITLSRTGCVKHTGRNLHCSISV